MPFYCGKRSTSICVVLGPKQSSTYSSEYASGFFEPAASHLPAPPSPRNEGLLGQTPSPRKARSQYKDGYATRQFLPRPNAIVVASKHPSRGLLIGPHQ